MQVFRLEILVAAEDVEAAANVLEHSSAREALEEAGLVVLRSGVVSGESIDAEGSPIWYARAANYHLGTETCPACAGTGRRS